MNNIDFHLENTWKIMCEESDTREFGKFISPVAEKSWVPEWLNSKGFKNNPAPLDEDGQCPKYDILEVSGKRIQVKFRGSKGKSGLPNLHMENTRRSSGKNLVGGAKNGQVRSAVTDSDAYLFVIPNGELWESEKWEVLIIPTAVLEDPKMPGYLTGRVPADIIKKYRSVDPVEVLNVV